MYLKILHLKIFTRNCGVLPHFKRIPTHHALFPPDILWMLHLVHGNFPPGLDALPHVFKKFTTFRNNTVFDIFSISPKAWFILSLKITMGTLDATMIVCEMAVKGCFCYIQIAT